MTRLLIVIGLLLLSGGGPAEETSTARWPTKYAAPAAEWQKLEVGDRFQYTTSSYLILSAKELALPQIEGIATMAESVPKVLALFPLPLLPDASEETEERRKGPKLKIITILPTQRDYLAAGGPAGSSGFYRGRSGDVVLSLEGLLQPKGPNSSLEPRQRFRLLVHELVHQATGRRLAFMPIWLREGLAEYFSVAQFDPGRYRFTDLQRPIIEHIQTIWAHDRRRTIRIPHLAELREMDYQAWNRDSAAAPRQAYAKYAASLLLAHYFLELATRGDTALKTMLDQEPEVEIVQDEERGRRYARYLPVNQEPLWKKRSPEEIEALLIRYWDKQGLGLSFLPFEKIAALPTAPDPFAD